MKQTTDQRYRRALHVCSAQLAGVGDQDPQDVALCFFRMGVVLSRLGEVGAAIRCFTDAFMLRDIGGESIKEHQWRQFHDTQMAIYILGKRRKTIASLAEGDMIHDLIKGRWEVLIKEMQNSEIPFAARDMRAWFRTVRIEFPWDLEDYPADEDTPFDRFYDDISEECVIITH